MREQQLLERITPNPKVMLGKPVIKGTRLTVEDECTSPAVAHWLRAQKHKVFSVYEQARRMEDDQVIAKAFAENWILITNDKDFGEKIYRERPLHEDERAANKIAIMQRLLEGYAGQLTDQFVVVTERQVRFARI